MACVTSNNLKIATGQDGKSPYFSTLSAYHIILPVDFANHVTDYSSAQATFRFFMGDKEQNVDYTNIVITPTSGVDVTYTIANEVGGKGVVITITDVADSVSSQLSLNIGYTLSGTTYTQVYTISKSADATELNGMLVSSITTPAIASPSSSEVLVKSVRIPANTMKSTGDVIDFTFHCYNNIIDDTSLITSYFKVFINNVLLNKYWIYSGSAFLTKVNADYDNHLASVTNITYNGVNAPFPLVVRNTVNSGQGIFTKPFIDSLNIDWAEDNYINIYCFLDSTKVSSSKVLTFDLFQLEYKHNLNNH